MLISIFFMRLNHTLDTFVFYFVIEFYRKYLVSTQSAYDLVKLNLI